MWNSEANRTSFTNKIMKKLYILMQDVDGTLDTAERLLAAEGFRDVEDVRALAFADEGEACGVHDVAEVVALAFNPGLHGVLGRFDVERLVRAEDFHHFRQLLGAVRLPSLFPGLLVILRRGDEEERGGIPEVADEADAVFHHADDLLDVLRVGVDAVRLEDWGEEAGNLGVALHLDVLMVEPLGFFVVELGSALAAVGQVEVADKLVHRHDLLVVPRIPAEQGKEVHDSLGEIAALAVAGGYFAGLRVVPLEGEDREAEAVAVALAEFAIPFGLQEQGEVGELRHGVFPAEETVEEDMERGAGEPFLATDDVRNLHQVVVHDVGQMVCRELVGRLVEDFIVQDGGVDNHFAPD